MLRDLCAHEQAAVGSAFDRELVGARVFRLDEPLSARIKIVEDILLVEEISSGVPTLAAFSATPKVSDRVDAALLEPRQTIRGEARADRDAVTPVTPKQRRIRSVTLHRFRRDDRHRY